MTTIAYLCLRKCNSNQVAIECYFWIRLKVIFEVELRSSDKELFLGAKIWKEGYMALRKYGAKNIILYHTMISLEIPDMEERIQALQLETIFLTKSKSRETAT